MKCFTEITALLICSLSSFAQGNVGIGTSSPKTLLHIAANRTILFGQDTAGGGSKLMWIPAKRAFRAGGIGPTDIFPAFDGAIWNYDSIGLYSFAGGLQNLASGSGTVTFGGQNTNSGAYSAVMGLKNVSRGVYSMISGFSNKSEANGVTIFGSMNEVSEQSNFVAGTYNLLTGNEIFVSGQNNKVAGNNSVVAGSQNSSTGGSSVIFGNGNENTSFQNYILGYNNKIAAPRSLALGGNNLLNAAQSLALGTGHRVNSFRVIALGSFADSVIGANPSDWIETDPLLIVGNSNSYSAPHNALVLTKQGNLGIGTNTPAAALQVVSHSTSIHPNVQITESFADYASLRFTNANPGYWDIAGFSQQILGNNGLAHLNFYFSKLGNNVLTLSGNGNAVLAGTLTQNSDARLKKNIVQMEKVLPALLRLHGYTYQWKEESKGVSEQVGLLAQEVEKQFPQLVETNGQGFKSIAYANMVPILLEAIREQQEQINELKQAMYNKTKRK